MSGPSRRQLPLTVLLAVVSLITISPFVMMLIVALTPAGEPTIPTRWRSCGASMPSHAGISRFSAASWRDTTRTDANIRASSTGRC